MMEPIPHKPIRFPGRPKGSSSKKRSITVPILHNDPIEYRIRVIREAGQTCIETIRCIAGVCETINRRCETTKPTEEMDDGTA